MKKLAEKRIKKSLISDTVGAFFLLQCLFLPLFPLAGKRVGAEELLLSSFSTNYDETKRERAENIALACRFLNGVKVASGEAFSFNGRVGERTEERGFLPAPVILEGKFVQGVGGGVCQVSTTLYNAVLQAGLTVEEVHPHSLPVSYVPPSLDAMVSHWSDFRFYNEKQTPVVLYASGKKGVLEVKIYGKSDGFSYKTKSVVLGEILPQEAEIVFGESEEIVKEERKGVRSEAYLLTYKRGKLTGGKRIRKDRYSPQRGIVQKIPPVEREIL